MTWASKYLDCEITGHTKPRQGTPKKKAENRISEADATSILRGKSNRNKGFICWTSVIRVGQPCVVPLPSWLGIGLSQWSRWVVTSPFVVLPEPSLDWWVWIAMFGTRRIFWQHSCFRNLWFLQYNQFCRFSNFKNLSSPELALYQGAFP